MKDVLTSLGVTDTPIITVYNKVDENAGFFTDETNAVVISAKTGDGVNKLKEMIVEKLF